MCLFCVVHVVCVCLCSECTVVCCVAVGCVWCGVVCTVCVCVHGVRLMVPIFHGETDVSITST